MLHVVVSVAICSTLYMPVAVFFNNICLFTLCSLSLNLTDTEQNKCQLYKPVVTRLFLQMSHMQYALLVPVFRVCRNNIGNVVDSLYIRCILCRYLQQKSTHRWKRLLE